MTFFRRIARRHRDIRRSGSAGFTILELLVTMSLMGVLGTVMFSTVVSVTRTVTHNEANADSVDIARVGLNRLSKNIRSGMSIQQSGLSDLPALAEIGPNKITVYGSLGPTPTKITYSINANRELEESWYAGNSASNPYWTFATTPRVEVIARKIPTTAAALFTFLDEGGAAITNQTSTAYADLSLVRSVAISLTVDSNPARGGGPVTLVNTVVLPNLGIAKR
ncbi:MAG: prepilin-type N-terminal cleavage/methylation domain-containing protein [Actinomycetes bacterium]